MTHYRIRLLALLAAAALAAAPAGAAGRTGRTAFDNAALERAIARAPADTAARIKAGRQDFERLLAACLDDRAGLLVLVDKTRALGKNEVPADLTALDGTGLAVSRKGLKLRAPALAAAKRMSRAAKADGVTLVFSSTYRSYQYQETVHARLVQQDGEEEANRESALPGHSQHQLGTAIDFGSIDDSFAGTKAGKWLARHAGEYGFSLSFPRGAEEVTGYRYEPWHYRYIGPAAAQLERQFFGSMQQHLLEFLHDYRNAGQE